MMKYRLEDGNIILADQDFIDAHHPGAVLLPDGPLPAQRAAILSQLAEIDAATDKPRTRRELLLNNAATKAWLTAQDAAAVALRADLTALG